MRRRSPLATGLRPGRGGAHRVAGVLQIERDEGGDRRFVFDDEDRLLRLLLCRHYGVVGGGGGVPSQKIAASRGTAFSAPPSREYVPLTPRSRTRALPTTERSMSRPWRIFKM